jgi:hypothetical protein
MRRSQVAQLSEREYVVIVNRQYVRRIFKVPLSCINKDGRKEDGAAQYINSHEPDSTEVLRSDVTVLTLDECEESGNLNCPFLRVGRKRSRRMALKLLTVGLQSLIRAGRWAVENFEALLLAFSCGFFVALFL